jgi:hypothetical protein
MEAGLEGALATAFGVFASVFAASALGYFGFAFWSPLNTSCAERCATKRVPQTKAATEVFTMAAPVLSKPRPLGKPLITGTVEVRYSPGAGRPFSGSFPPLSRGIEAFSSPLSPLCSRALTPAEVVVICRGHRSGYSSLGEGSCYAVFVSAFQLSSLSSSFEERAGVRSRCAFPISAFSLSAVAERAAGQARETES